MVSLLQHGGRVALEGSVEEKEQALAEANDSPLRPRGWRVTGRNLWLGRGDAELVRLWPEAIGERPVHALPGRIGLSASTAFLAEPDWQFVSSTAAPHAAILLDRLEYEAILRGYEVRPGAAVPGSLTLREQKRSKEAHLLVRRGDEEYGLLVKEIAGRSTGVPVHDLPDRNRLPRWQQVRTHQFTSTGKLELYATGGRASGVSTFWKDSKEGRPEESIGEVFRTLEIWEVAKLEQVVEADFAAGEAAVREEHAREVEQTRGLLAKRETALASAARSWEQAERVRAYLTALRDPKSTDARLWSAWADRHLPRRADDVLPPYPREL